MSIFKRVLFALIYALTIYIGNVYNFPPKRGGHPTPPAPLPDPPPYLQPWAMALQCTVTSHLYATPDYYLHHEMAFIYRWNDASFLPLHYFCTCCHMLIHFYILQEETNKTDIILCPGAHNFLESKNNTVIRPL